MQARHADAGGGFYWGYGVVLYPDDRYGHGGGDPGVEVTANRWPVDDVNLVALCNLEYPVHEVRDRMVGWHGSPGC